jgi:hypothetical protein
MSHQDWNTVIIRGKTNSVQKQVVKRPQHVNRTPKDVDIHENGPETKISTELRKKLVECRTAKEKNMSDLAVAAGQCGKKLTVKDIQQAEQGHCTMKQGKQIALIYEKVLRVKIL